MSEAEKYFSNPAAGHVIHSASGSLAERLQTEESKQRQTAKVKRFLAAAAAAKKTTGGRRTRRRGARKSRRGKGKGKSRRRGRSKKCKCSLL